MSNREAHVAFGLPGFPQTTRATKNGVSTAQTTFAIDDDDALSVGIVNLPSASTAAGELRAYPDLIKSQFEVVSPPDFAISERHRGRYSGRPSYDMRIRFTPVNFPHESMVWFLRVVQDGHYLVLLQTISSAPKSDEANYVAICRLLQAKLVRSVAFT